jgi:hypothetical protein
VFKAQLTFCPEHQLVHLTLYGTVDEDGVLMPPVSLTFAPEHLLGLARAIGRFLITGLARGQFCTELSLPPAPFITRAGRA